VHHLLGAGDLHDEAQVAVEDVAVVVVLVLEHALPEA